MCACGYLSVSLHVLLDMCVYGYRKQHVTRRTQHAAPWFGNPIVMPELSKKHLPTLWCWDESGEKEEQLGRFLAALWWAVIDQIGVWICQIIWGAFVKAAQLNQSKQCWTEPYGSDPLLKYTYPSHPLSHTGICFSFIFVLGYSFRLLVFPIFWKGQFTQITKKYCMFWHISAFNHAHSWWDGFIFLRFETKH